MKIRSILTFTLLIVSYHFCYAQNLDEKILMTVAGREVEAGEFIRMYNKSLDPESGTNLDDYLEQFVAFKLKVADAIDKGYDTARVYREELNGYRNQLAQNYLTDPGIKENLIRKAYQRSLTEVKASHILVSCPPDASPEDTLEAYKKAAGIRERIIKGENFEQVAKSTSDDRSVVTNGGNLGYFTVFQMITPFEEAAYTLKAGNLSMPVRSSFGYHIIKVSDSRPSRGKIRVAHIMKAAPPGSDEQKIREAEKEINEIYTLLNNGASFRKMAADHSDHRESAVNGGELNWFGTGEIISDFSEAAFSIQDTGQYTKPVRTVNGFHIIKLLDRRPHGSFEETRSFLESRLNQSNLISLGKKSFIDRLKKEYNLRINPALHSWFVNNTDTLIIRGISKYDRKKMPAGDIYTFADRNFTAGEFADYLENRGYRIITDSPEQYINKSIESIVSNELIKYEDSVLEQKYPDFRYLMKEFHDGILLFEISSEKVWNRVQKDSSGIHAYYERNKHSYMTDENIEAKIYTLNEPGGKKRLTSSYRKYSRKADTDRRLLEKFNGSEDTLLTIKEGRWFRGEDPDIDKIKWITGVQKFSKNGMPSLIRILKVNEPEPLPFNEVQSEIISGYQEWLTGEWIKQLKDKYTVKIDDQVFNEVKKRLGNE